MRVYMFDELQEAWITEEYKSYRGILVPSLTKQLSTAGLILDLDSLPTKPYPFKELFIRWLISINKPRLMKKEPIIITQLIVMKCPLWRIVKCPLKRIDLTKEGVFNKPSVATTSFGPKGPVGSINSGK
jgi:hypothetical protein